MPTQKNTHHAYTQSTHTDSPHAPRKKQRRIGMNVLMIVCAALTFIFATMIIGQPSMIAPTLFFGIFSVMFFILGKSPKKNPYLFGKGAGLKKKLFVPLCVVLALACTGFPVPGANNNDSSDVVIPTTTSGAPTTIAEGIITAEPIEIASPTPTEAPTLVPTDAPTSTSEITVSPVPTDTPAPTQDVTQYVLKQGDKNDNVKALQKVLISLGWLSGSADGDYGPKTVAAVKAYQDAVGLPVTGECDYDTYISLTSANAPVAPVQVEEEEESDEVAYIGNRNSDKFHYPSCSSVDDMKESNKVEFYSRDEATGAGYKPCGRCHP